MDYATVNKDRVQLWLDALRSGEYGQCASRLRGFDQETGQPNNDYCCLGVATKVYIDNAGLEGEKLEYAQGQLDTGALLSQEVSAWYGFPQTYDHWFVDSPLVNSNDSLASLNDTGSTFEEIATQIEDVILAGKLVSFASMDDPDEEEVPF